MRRALSFSNVVALIALFVALGGSVYAAGKLSGTQIRPNSLPGNRVKAKSLTGSQIKANSIPGNRIKAKTLTGGQIKSGSLTGNEINEGSLVDVAAGTLAGVHYATSVVQLTAPSGGFPPVFTPTAGTASCPPGTNVIGGGATVNDENNAEVNDGGPNSTRTGWTATGFGLDAGKTMTVTAICVPVKSVTG